ncbi:quinone oxidoreductase-like [Anneissia japonica]|uniref:quinone oxidoreductase-like n=1 Tax=Anneissia japonica TaxID=1529436 RepID=UPI0014256B33|nr:quinone oxidoreductase-like [Anneissia japonica]
MNYCVIYFLPICLLFLSFALCLPDSCQESTEDPICSKASMHVSRTLHQATMRAVRVHAFGGPDKLKLDSDVPIPEPNEKQVLVRVHAAGVNPVETYLRQGTYHIKPPLPWIPGNDCAGVVEKVGPGVSKYKTGDRVFTYKSVTGSYAEYTVTNEKDVFTLPAPLSFQQGAAMGIPYFTAYHALILRAKAKAGHKVLVHGASGSVGIASVQLAKAYGMTVYGTAGSPEGLELVRNAGAKMSFNHRQPGYTDKIMEATDGSGVDVIIEMLANVNLQKDLELLARGGTVAVVGNRGNIEINPRLMMLKESSIVGVLIPPDAEAIKLQINAALQPGMEQGWIQPVIGKEYSMAEAGQAHEDVVSTKPTLGRLVIVP